MQGSHRCRTQCRDTQSRVGALSVLLRIPGVLRTHPAQKMIQKRSPLDTFHKQCSFEVYLRKAKQVIFLNHCKHANEDFIVKLKSHQNSSLTFGLNAGSGAARGVSDTEAISPVKALLTPADPVVERSALRLHLLVRGAEVVAVQTPWKVVPQLGEMVRFARRTLSGRGGGAVSDHVSAWLTLVTCEDSPGKLVLVLIGWSGIS